VVVDLGERGAVVGIDIDHASAVTDLSRLEIRALPLASIQFAPGGIEASA